MNLKEPRATGVFLFQLLASYDMHTGTKGLIQYWLIGKATF
jgi:hypothetical protein